MTERSFSAAAADEAARGGTASAAGDVAELAGFCRAAGSIHVRGGHTFLELALGRAAAARRAYKLCRVVGLPAEIWARRQRRLRGGNVYLVRISDAPSAVERLRLTSSRPVRRREAARGLLRGLFLGSGSVSDPRGQHHLEIGVTDPASAALAIAAAQRFDIALHRTERRAQTVLYLKDAPQIADLLRLVGAPAASFAYEDARILRDVRSRVNRLVNADTANLTKTVTAALRQSEAIQALAAGGRLADLPPGLREVADLRLSHPDLSLRELGDLCTPPLGKSGVNHRLRLLVRLAAQVSAGGGGRRNEG